jgi:DNA polymerase I-like protein with 3'-5' exonuclease and polymerase domains
MLITSDKMIRTMTMIFLDIETNLKHDTIWLCVTKHNTTGEVRHWREADTLQQYLDGEQVVGHNIIGFDAPILKKVWGVGIPTNKLVDTLVMSRLYKPDIDLVIPEQGKAPTPHSLEAWGYRLGSYKIGFTDFDSGWSEEMATYCEQDVQLLEKLYNFLTTTMTKEGFSLQSIQLEHEVALICRGMEDNGFMLDMPKAMVLNATLSGRMSDIEESMQQVFPPIVEERISEKTGKQLKDKITVFNPGSRQQIAERLAGLGVVFTKKTDKGNVIVDEAVLEKIDLPEAKLVAEYLMIQKRVAQISSWLELVGDDGRVHGRVTTNGAVTGRATHSSPNMAQVPAVGSPFGAECREMWCVPVGYKQVGVDLSGIELRCLGHYLRDQEWIDELLKGDIHWFNAQSFGLVERGTVKDDNNPEHKKARNITKTLTYGVLYGAGAAKAGSIVGGNSSRGKKLIDSFINNTPGLAELKKKISKLMTKGHLPALDGRRVWVRSEHAALNTLLQSAGAIVAKQWLIESTKLLQEKGIDAKLLAFVHDETQWEVKEDQAEEAARLIEQAATKAGEALGFRCPVDAEGKVGNNWRECH